LELLVLVEMCPPVCGVQNGSKANVTEPNMSLSDLITDVISRITFSYSLFWRFDDSQVKLITDEDTVLFRDKFRFDENRNWLEIQLSAPADPEPRYPHIDLNIRMPFPVDDLDYDLEALTIANEMNSAGLCCSAMFNFKDRCIHINSNICYSGYQDQAGSENGNSGAQAEATLKWLCAAMELADEWESWIHKLANTKHVTARTLITQKNIKIRDIKLEQNKMVHI